MTDFRAIPSIEQLRQRDTVRGLEARYGRQAVVEALREAAGAFRRTLPRQAAARHDSPADEIVFDAESRLSQAFAPSLRSVVNATGVVLHTNLGRAPLAAAALQRIAALCAGYTNLEYDVERGARGSRSVHAEALLVRLTGAEAAVVVNNNAGATLLMLAALAAGREVVISRGELVEIGGGFRVPDVMAQSGAILREVGTTNRTRASDYAAAVNERTALILRVHPSNFRIDGFTERPSLDELVSVGARLQVPVAEDLGSGALMPLVPREPLVGASVTAGAGVICFSGDKLLGGPQAGIIIGRRDLVDTIRRHPLMRALRVDKLTYAALEATLVEYLAGRAEATVPVVRMLSMSVGDIEARAQELARSARADGWHAYVIDGTSTSGGGSAPGVALATKLLALGRAGYSPVALEQWLRTASPPIVGRIEDERVVLDLRTVLPEQDAIIAGALGAFPS